jgi:frataxin-like iron-binding protein CyaY
MNDEEFHRQADQFALEVERKIEETSQFLSELPEFERRSQKAQKLQRKIENH